jgi:hypothetical protein
LGERVANLESAENVDHSARHSPETEPNEAIYRGTNHKAEREQPRINVTAARHRAHEPIEPRKIVQVSTDSSLNEFSGPETTAAVAP